MDFATPPPADRPMMETIDVLGDLATPTSYSQGTDVDSEMQDTDWINHSGDNLSCDSPCRPSIEFDDDAALRGGVLYPPPNLAWARKVAVASRQKQQIKYDEYDEDEARIDYGGLEDASEDDGYSTSSTSSDWDGYGTLPLTMDEYDGTVAHMEGSEEWNAEQKKLHKLIYMRGLHPMMPSWWRVSLKMWGVTQPHLDDLFTPTHSKKRVAIHSYGNEVAAGKALESLFYLSQTVTDYEEMGYEDRIARTVVRGIRNYIKWAMRDVGIDTRKTQLNMLVQAYPPDFLGDDDSDDAESDFAPSPVSSNEEHDGGIADTDRDKGDDDEAFEVDEAQRARRFTRAVSRDLEKRLRNMGQRWRDLLRKKRAKSFIAPPPTLYAFAVIQHIVLLASHDPSDTTNPVVVLEQVVLNDRGQWLWNALSIALPVNMARDALNGMWDTGVIMAEHEDSEEDPDL
ncbi:hypothetical protein C8A01DRAFT_15056 [Parachaetomium inaequale]|uniref:Uncharacterized protein n=1 Tax=Parachaetomium inaequale TaxID=2588326 RepID=A0AAN6SSZ3_9PEZI|nr:hypothetical protein C8A01DRAFT_15056 [Parachaetomium inaequale]